MVRFRNEGAVPYRQQAICAFFPLHREDALPGSTVNTTTVEAEVEANSAGAQYLQPPPEGWDSGRDDGIARPSQGRLNISRSEDRATGHDNEVVLGHRQTSVETLRTGESAAAAAAPTMAPGAIFREENSLARVEGTSPHGRENVPEGAQGQETLHEEQQQQPHQPGSGDAFGNKQGVTVVPTPEDVPPDAENIEADSRITVEMESCPEPKTAKSKKRVRRSRGSEAGARVAGWGPVRRLLWRTRPRPSRARHKRSRAGSWTLNPRQQVLVYSFLFLRLRFSVDIWYDLSWGIVFLS